VIDAGPGVVLNVDVVGGSELPGAASAVRDDGADAGENCTIRSALIPDSKDHGAVCREMTFVGRGYDVLLDAAKSEIGERLGMLLGIVPLVGPRHCDGDRLSSCCDVDMDISATWRRPVYAAGVVVGGIHLHSFVVGTDPVEDSALTEGRYGEGAEQHGQSKHVSHDASIYVVERGIQAKSGG
jgi:hypothetical protein